MQQKHIVLLVLVLSMIIAVFTHGTYDEGDSIMHYLFAHSLFQHPENILDYWAKPFFTLLASPFAFWGWTGMKIFNTLMIFFSAVLAWKIAEQLNLPHPFFAFILCYTAPKNFLIQYSGLTEPLFGLILILPVYLWLNGNKNWALIILSFIPFVRSEGMIMIIIWVFFLLFNLNWKKLPLLFFGFLVYAIAGYYLKDNFWWYFTDNTYAETGAKYGVGKWYHFLCEFPKLTGIPFAVLVLTGISAFIIVLKNTIKPFRDKKISVEFFVVYGPLFAMIFSHSYFLYFGLYGEFGMTRVMIPVIPLAAILALRGIKGLFHLFQNKVTEFVYEKIIAVILLAFPFISGTGYGIDLKKDFSLNHLQKVQLLAAEWMQVNGVRSYPLYSTPVFINMKLNIDHFDPNQFLHAHKYENMKKGDYLLWDSWYAVMEEDVSKKELIENKSLELVKIFSIHDKWSKDADYEVVIFRKK